MGEQMNLEEQSATLQRRILDANKNWRHFMSEMPLREESFLFEPQSLQTNVAIAQHDAVGHPLFCAQPYPNPHLEILIVVTLEPSSTKEKNFSST
jgi:hypothetical protein